MKVTFAIALLLADTSAIKLRNRQDGPAAATFIDAELHEAEQFLEDHKDEEIAEINALETELGTLLESDGIHLDTPPLTGEEIYDIVDGLGAEAINEFEADETEIADALNGLESEAIALENTYQLAQTKGRSSLAAHLRNKAKGKAKQSPDDVASLIESNVNSVADLFADEEAGANAVAGVESMIASNVEHGTGNDVRGEMPDPKVVAHDLKEMTGQLKAGMPPHDALVSTILSTVQEVQTQLQMAAQGLMQSIEQGAKHYGIPLPGPDATEEEGFVFITKLLGAAINDGFLDELIENIARDSGQSKDDVKKEILRGLEHPENMEKLAKDLESSPPAEALKNSGLI